MFCASAPLTLVMLSFRSGLLGVRWGGVVEAMTVVAIILTVVATVVTITISTPTRLLVVSSTPTVIERKFNYLLPDSCASLSYSFRWANMIQAPTHQSFFQFKHCAECHGPVRAVENNTDNYGSFLKDAKPQLLAATLPAWKHRKILEGKIKDFLANAVQSHVPQISQMCEASTTTLAIEMWKPNSWKSQGKLVKISSAPAPAASRCGNSAHAGDDEMQYVDDVVFVLWFCPKDEVIDID